MIAALLLLAAQTAMSQGPMPRVDADLKSFDESVAKLEKDLDPGPPDPASKDWVAKKLRLMTQVDQFMRHRVDLPFKQGYSKDEESYFWSLFGPRWEKIDTDNTAALKELLKARDWFKISEFGAEGDENAWLLVQHADRDVPFQKRVLSVLARLYPLGETSAHNYAFLHDRVAAAEKRPQRYGTQGRCTGPGAWEPFEMEDPAGVDARRKAMGLSTLEENKRRLAPVCH